MGDRVEGTSRLNRECLIFVLMAVVAERTCDLSVPDGHPREWDIYIINARVPGTAGCNLCKIYCPPFKEIP